jgi:hypothetical protein
MPKLSLCEKIEASLCWPGGDQNFAGLAVIKTLLAWR